MTHKDSDGGVITVYWSCVAASDEGPQAKEEGKLTCDPDPLSPSYIPYADLTEADVLGWVYASLVKKEETPEGEETLEDEETPEEARVRVEADLAAKVDVQVSRMSTQSNGLPWAILENA